MFGITQLSNHKKASINATSSARKTLQRNSVRLLLMSISKCSEGTPQTTMSLSLEISDLRSKTVAFSFSILAGILAEKSFWNLGNLRWCSSLLTRIM